VYLLKAPKGCEQEVLKRWDDPLVLLILMIEDLGAKDSPKTRTHMLDPFPVEGNVVKLSIK